MKATSLTYLKSRLWNATKVLIGVFTLITVLTGCSNYDADGVVVKIDRDYYELQHRFADTYMLHKLDKVEIDKLKSKLDAVK